VACDVLGPRLGRAGTRVERKGGESSEEAVSGRGRVRGSGLRIKLESSCRSLTLPCVNHLSDSSFDSPRFYSTYISPPRNRVAPKNMTFKMAEFKNVLTWTVKGWNLGAAWMPLTVYSKRLKGNVEVWIHKADWKIHDYKCNRLTLRLALNLQLTAVQYSVVMLSFISSFL